MTETKNILLVSANRHQEPYPVYPLGVSYLATALRERFTEFNVAVFDVNLASLDELAAVIKKLNPVYIGVSLRNADGADSLNNTSFLGIYEDIIKVIRRNSGAVLIIGGAGFSLFPEIFMRELKADYGLRGEGEVTLPELISRLDKGESPENIEGLVTLQEGKCICNDRSNYLRTTHVIFEDSLTDYYWKHSGMLNIQTKRGCPYRCIYCSYPVIEGRKVRTLAADAIVENILRLKKDRGINYFFFTDSVFNISNEYNCELAEKLIRSNAGISWGAYFTPRNLDDEFTGLLKRSGLTHVEFGTESFSDECLVKYGKSFTVDDVVQSSDMCLKHNIYYAHFLILGGYGETAQTVSETIENAKRVHYTVFFPFVGMRIYPYTRLQEIAVAEGKLSPEDNLIDPRYYIAEGFNLEKTREAALATGKAWVFPDDPKNQLMDELRMKRNKKGPIWEYLRKP